MDVGETCAVADGSIHLVETGMYDVTGYGGVYLVEAERPAIVETGMGTNADALLDAIERIGYEPTDIAVIAVTHVHLDHAGGAGHLAAACPNATVIAHEIGAPHLVDPDRLVAGTKEAVGDQWRYYADPRPVPADRVRAIGEKDVVDLGDRRLVAHEAPGHAPHQVVYHLPDADAVFTGDAAGIWVPEREEVVETSPPPQFDLDDAVADLDTIEALDPAVLLYTHFGPVPVEPGHFETYERTLAQWIRDVDAASVDGDGEDAVVDRLVGRHDLAAVWGEEKARAETAVNVRGALAYLADVRGED